MDKVKIVTTIQFTQTIPLSAYPLQMLTEAILFEQNKEKAELLMDAIEVMEGMDEDRIIIDQTVTGERDGMR